MKRDLHDEAHRLVIARDVRSYGYIRRAVGEAAQPFPLSGVFEVKIDLDATSEHKFGPLGTIEHIVRAATYEWKCLHCGETTYVPSEGGNLESCDCDKQGGAGIGVWVILNGKRTYMGTADRPREWGKHDEPPAGRAA